VVKGGSSIPSGGHMQLKTLNRILGASIGPTKPARPTFNPVNYPTLTHLQVEKQKQTVNTKVKQKLQLN